RISDTNPPAGAPRLRAGFCRGRSFPVAKRPPVLYNKRISNKRNQMIREVLSMKQRAPFFARPAASRKPAMKHTRLIALLAATCLLPALAGCAAEPAAPSSAEDAPEDSTPSTVDF